MYDSYENIRKMVLHRTLDWNFDGISLDGNMIDLLGAINGQRTIEDINNILQLSEIELCNAITRLFIKGLVAEAPGFKFVAPNEFFGPIGGEGVRENILT